MDRKAYENFLIENCPEAWRKHKNGKNAVAAGWTLFALGAGMMVPGWTLFGLYDYHYDGIVGMGLGCAGCGLVGVGLVTFIGGYASKSAALKTYNKKCANNPVSLNLTSGKNGLGLAINF